MNVAMEPTWPEHALVCVLVVLGAVAVLRGQPRMKHIEFDTPTRITTYWANSAVLALAGLAPVVLWLLAGRPLIDLGFQRGRYGPAAVGLTLLFVGWYALDARWRTTGPRLARTVERWRRDTPFMPTTPRELRHFTVLAFAAGVFEEILFRGFLILYVASWTGGGAAGTLLAVALPALGFGIVHLYQGWRLVTWIAGMSILFGGIFVLSGSLLIPIVLHIVMDLIGGLMSVRYVTGAGGPEAGVAPAHGMGS